MTGVAPPSGHGKEVRSVDWHPSRALFVSGARDGVIRFWDPRTGDTAASGEGLWVWWV